MVSKKSKEQIYKDALSLFVKKPIPVELLSTFINYTDGDDITDIQDWIGNNMRDEISDWCTSIGIIDSVELLYNEALDNGNIKPEDN